LPGHIIRQASVSAGVQLVGALQFDRAFFKQVRKVYNGVEDLSQISEKFNIWCSQSCWIIVYYVNLFLEKKFVKKVSYRVLWWNLKGLKI
jgi:hypothetical protein